MAEEKVIFEKVYPEYNIHRTHFEELDSTQLYCRRHMMYYIKNELLNNINKVIAISANSQTNGIGTRDTKEKKDRIWLSEKGNLFISFMQLWPIDDLLKIQCMAQTCTVAISKTLECFYLVTQIKWINDVLVNEKKISGCLSNLYYLDDCMGLEKKYVYIIVGIGININLVDNKNILFNNYTSIKKELKKDFNDVTLVPSVETVTNKLIENYYLVMNKLRNEGFSYFLEYINIRLLYKGKKIIIDQDNNKMVGYLKGILADGSLCLLQQNNEIIRVNTGKMYLYEN
ncbi:biotin protein ligase, putative [Hepatocystis sp. ex Piliocolobus tephrosceles]|nr:biotin protein ligase, putative [Hepatocystis sp. ex Piliocolobus tephrosceles]